MQDIRIAAALMRSVVGDKEGNLARTRALASEAAADGADLAVFPEAGLTGYTVRESMARWAETVPGPLTSAVGKIASEFDLFILAGLVEKDAGDADYLTQVLVGPEGLIGAYRKTHLGPTERTRFSAGDELGIVKTPRAVFGVQLCYEGHFPEIALAQALAGAEVLLIPHASPREEPREKLDRWLRYLPARAYDNTAFAVAVNPVGDNGAGLTFAGAAVIVGPKGEVLAKAARHDEGLIAADLRGKDLAAVKERPMGYFLGQRRTELYGLPEREKKVGAPAEPVDGETPAEE